LSTSPISEKTASTLVVDVSGLTVQYRGNGAARRPALRGVTISVSEGDALVIVGPNGSGKSTLLHAIAGSVEADVSGEMVLFGRRVQREPQHRRSQWLALVHQDPSRGTAAHLSLREHCELTVAWTGRQAVHWAQVSQRLESLGTTLDPKTPAGELSGGQRQLFALLLAVLSAPKLLLLDEPMSALDARHAALVLQIIQEFSERPDAATILVTHDPAEACAVGNRLLVLNSRGEPQAALDAEHKSALTAEGLVKLLSQATAVAWKTASSETSKDS